MLNNIKNAAWLFILSAILNMLLLIISGDASSMISYGVIRIYSFVPITFYSLFLVNMSGIGFIYVVGKKYTKVTDFFVVLNGMMLGVFLSLYSDRLILLWGLLMPHMLFETTGIILLCSAVKTLSQAISADDKRSSVNAHIVIGMVCVPLFLISLLLEVY